jgi:transposase
MRNFRDYDRTQRFLLPPDLSDWVADDDLAHFIVAAVERVDISAFHVSRTGSGKAQYHPRMMLALLIYCYASGIFSSRRIERATHRDVSVRFIAANSHPDHDTIAKFRRDNIRAFEVAFEQLLLLASEAGLLKVGTVSVDGTKIDANASKIKSIRYDRLQVLRAKLGEDIAALTAKAEAADLVLEDDGLSLPGEIVRRETLKAKLDAAAKRLEEAAARDHEGDDDPPAPEASRQTNLTDPDSAIMRKSARHEYRQAYNAQAAVDADGSMLVVASDVLNTTNDRAGLDGLLDQMTDGSRSPKTLLADAGYAGEEVVKALEKCGIDPLIAISRQQHERPYDFRPPPKQGKSPKAITAQWRLDMIDKLQTEPARKQYRKRKQTVEPVFGIIKSILGFTRFHLRGIENVKSEWTLTTLAYNCKRLSKMMA